MESSIPSLDAQLLYKLGVVETGIKNIEEKLTRALQDTANDLKGHETRLTELERWKERVMARVTIIGSLGVLTVTALEHFLFKAWY